MRPCEVGWAWSYQLSAMRSAVQGQWHCPTNYPLRRAPFVMLLFIVLADNMDCPLGCGVHA